MRGSRAQVSQDDERTKSRPGPRRAPRCRLALADSPLPARHAPCAHAASGSVQPRASHRLGSACRGLIRPPGRVGSGFVVRAFFFVGVRAARAFSQLRAYRHGRYREVQNFR